jgi:hypothetical protein
MMPPVYPNEPTFSRPCGADRLVCAGPLDPPVPHNHYPLTTSHQPRRAKLAP